MSYPATVTIDRPERIANWRPIFHLALSLPHFVILHTVVNIMASITALSLGLRSCSRAGCRQASRR